jgi:hypothetical protein
MHRMNSFDRFDSKEQSYGRYLQFKMGNFVSNSTQLITDMASVITNGNSAASQALAIAAAGPIMDLPGVLASVKLNFQEAAEKLAYVLQGSQIQSGSPITAPTGGVITSTSDSTNYNLLTGIYQILK